MRISYPINDTELHEDYLDNRSALKTIKTYFINSPKIDSIVIYSYASPEGPYRLNKRLAKERGERARRYLLLAKTNNLEQNNQSLTTLVHSKNYCIRETYLILFDNMEPRSMEKLGDLGLRKLIGNESWEN